MPGIPFLVVGLVILSTEYLWAHHILTKLTSRFPQVATHLHAAREKAQRWTGPIGD
jgi:putative transmembrane protein PGPGW